MAYTCGACGQQGHSRRSCRGNASAPRTENAPASAAPAGAKQRRTVVIVDCPGDKGVFADAFEAVTRGDATSWDVIAADGLAAGVRTAIALQADHVVLCVSRDMDKATLKPWTQRLRSIVGVQIIAVYDSYAKLDALSNEVKALGADDWMSTDRTSRLESTIVEWESPEEWIKPPAPWMSPLLPLVN